MLINTILYWNSRMVYKKIPAVHTREARMLISHILGGVETSFQMLWMIYSNYGVCSLISWSARRNCVIPLFFYIDVFYCIPNIFSEQNNKYTQENIHVWFREIKESSVIRISVNCENLILIRFTTHSNYKYVKLLLFENPGNRNMIKCHEL